jgi:hypothetical protein
MDEVIWIEVLARQREIVARQRAVGAVITIGRAYDNDVVLDDPHVAPHHVRLLRAQDERWRADDLGSLNGISATGVRQRHAKSILLDGDTVLRLGQTGIRVRSSEYAVPPERPLAHDAQARWFFALVCLAALLGLTSLQSWLSQTGSFKLIGYLGQLVGIAIIAVVWTSLWSTMARILTARAQYGRHLFIASAGLLVFTVYNLLAEIGAFALSLPVLTAYVFAGGWLILAAVCFAHLRALSPSQWVLKAVCVLALAGVGIAMQGMTVADLRSRTGQPSAAILETLQPPALRLVRPQAQGVFFDSAARLKASLDKARTESLSPGSDDDGD